MGCGSSLSAEFQGKYTASIQLSAAQKKIVRETWEFVEQRMSYVGKRMFLKFFENNPEYKRLFPEFKDLSLSDIEKTKELHGHAKRVMKALENAVSAMDDAEIFAAYLDELGRRHKDRPMKPLHLDSVKTALMFTLQELFKSSWTEETAEAWNKLFMFIRDQMSMQTALMSTLQDLLKSSWTEETAEAWNKLFMFVKDQMIRGLQS